MIEKYSEKVIVLFSELRLFQLVIVFFFSTVTPNFYHSTTKFVHLPTF